MKSFPECCDNTCANIEIDASFFNLLERLFYLHLLLLSDLKVFPFIEFELFYWDLQKIQFSNYKNKEESSSN
jgi:hypothetical protein